MNQMHVVPSASGKYSNRMDDLVAASSATLLAMNERNASIPPPIAAFVHSRGRKERFLPAAFLSSRGDALLGLENARRAELRQ
jgi:hypothetical protein